MRRRHLAAAIMAGLIIVFGLSGCTTIETTNQDRVEAILKVDAPYHVRGVVNGKIKCNMSGTGKLILRGKPGTCLAVSDSGHYHKVQCP